MKIPILDIVLLMIALVLFCILLHLIFKRPCYDDGFWDSAMVIILDGAIAIAIYSMFLCV